MKKTLTAIARDRRCQALLSLMRKARDQVFHPRRPASDPEQYAAEQQAKPENIFRDA